MKHRNGFVSNSSSSSFIIALPKKPETYEELKDMLMLKSKTVQADNKKIKVKKLLYLILEGFKKARTYTIDEAVTLYAFLVKTPCQKITWEHTYTYKQEKIMRDYMQGWEDGVIYIMEYEDLPGTPESIYLESGKLFKHIPFIKFGHKYDEAGESTI